MKRILSILSLLLVLSSCNYTPTPYGVWHSDDPEMTLFIIKEDRTWDWGELILNGEYHDLIVECNPGLHLTDRSNLTETGLRGDRDIMGGSYYFEGRYHEKLRFVLTSRYAEATGYKTIYFTKVADTYEEYLAKKEAGELD